MKLLLSTVGVLVTVVLLVSGLSRIGSGADGAAVAAGAAWSAEANPASGGPCYQLVVPLGSVMEIVDDVFAKMPETASTASRRGFRVLKREAEFLAEMGNLAGRIDGKCKEKEWVELSNRMKTTALALAEAAGKGDKEEFLKQYEEVKGTCGACHDKFRD